MTQDEILERIRKRKEEMAEENQVLTFDTDEETGETTLSLNTDNLTTQQELYMRVKAIQNGYKSEDYELAKAQADRAENELLKNASREELADFYRVYSDEMNRAQQNQDKIGYNKNLILLGRVQNKLGNSATPLTYAQDWGQEVTSNVKGFVADTANLAALGYISLTDNLDADVLYNVAKSTGGNLQNTLDNYGWGKENYERLVKLKAQFPNDEIVDTLYNTVTKQNFKGDKDYFDKTVKYINEELSNKARFDTFQRSHTLDETQERENLKLRESMMYNDAGKFWLDTVGTVSYMLPSIALGAGAGSLASGGVSVATKEGGKVLLKGVSKDVASEIAKQVGLTTMSAAAAGSSGTQALNQGYRWNQALAKAGTDGLLEYVSELVGGESLNKLLVGTKTAVTPLGKFIGKGIDKLGIKHKWARLGIQALGDITAEAWEEMATEIGSQLLDEIILNEKITDWEKFGEDVLNSGIQSILPTLILGGMNRVQVANKIKSQMEAMTLAVEMNQYLTKEQKEKLLDGIVQAYDNAKHLLSDEQSEEQYNEVVKEVYKALEEAEPRYESARDLVNVLRARLGQQQAIEAEKAKETVDNRLNTQRGTDLIDNTTRAQNTKANLGHLLNTGALGSNTNQQQEDIDIKEGDTFVLPNVNNNGKDTVTLKVRAIGPDENTGELMAVVETDFGKGQPIVIPLANLKKRIIELQNYKPANEVTNNNVYDDLKQKGSKEITSSNGVNYLQIGRFTKIDEGKFDRNNVPSKSELDNAPVKIFILYNSVGSSLSETENRVYKNIADLREDLPISWLNKNTRGYRITSLAGHGGLVYTNTPYNRSYTWYVGPDRIQDLTSETKGKQPTPPKEYIPQTKRKFLKDYKHVGYVNVNGAVIKNIDDLADICQIFRDPLYETLRVLLLKDNVVVGQFAITTYSARKVPWSQDMTAKLREMMKKAGANKYYVMHNHPSSNVEPSSGDINVTKYFNKSRLGVEFGGQIVIDHNEYSYISPSGRTSTHIKLKNGTFNELEKDFSKEAWTNIKISSRDDIAKLGSLVKNGKDFSSLVFLARNNTARVLQEVPNSFFDNTSEKIKSYLKDIALKNGATSVAIATTDKSLLNTIARKKLNLFDVVAYEEKENGALEITRSLLREGELPNQRVLFRDTSKVTSKDIISPPIEEQLKGKKVTNEEIKGLKKETTKPIKSFKKAQNNKQFEGILYSSDNLKESTELFEAILSQLDEKEVNEEAIKLWEQETGEDWQMDGWDNVSEELMNRAEEIVYNRFVNSEKGQKFISDFNKNKSKKEPLKILESKKKNTEQAFIKTEPTSLPQTTQDILDTLYVEAGDDLSFDEATLESNIQHKLEDKTTQELVDLAKQYGLKLTKEDFEEDEDGDVGEGYTDLYNAISNQVDEELKKAGYKNIDGEYFNEEAVTNGYDELLDWLDDNEIDYETSKSSIGGIVPSIYIKNSNGDTIMRISNHLNHQSSSLSKADLYTYKNYANWEEDILPDIENKLNKQDSSTEKKFATNIERYPGSIFERKIREIEANPKLREEHEVVSTTQILNEVRQKLINGRFGVRQYRHKAYGVYNTLSNWIRLAQVSDVDTLMHEMGHFIDDEILPKMYQNNAEMKKELGKLCDKTFPRSISWSSKIRRRLCRSNKIFHYRTRRLS